MISLLERSSDNLSSVVVGLDDRKIECQFQADIFSHKDSNRTHKGLIPQR